MHGLATTIASTGAWLHALICKPPSIVVSASTNIAKESAILRWLFRLLEVAVDAAHHNSAFSEGGRPLPQRPALVYFN